MISGHRLETVVTIVAVFFAAFVIGLGVSAYAAPDPRSTSPFASEPWSTIARPFSPR